MNNIQEALDLISNKCMDHGKKWQKIGTSTERIDREKCENIIRSLYEIAGIESPSNFIYFDSPKAAFMNATDLFERDSCEVYMKVYKDVLEKADDQVSTLSDMAIISDQLMKYVGKPMQYQFMSRIDRLLCEYYISVKYASKKNDESDDILYHSVDALNFVGHGSQDSRWLCFYDFILNELPCQDLQHFKNVKLLIDLSYVCGWWWPFKDTVLITDKPNVFTIEDGKLNKFSYPDGFGWERDENTK